MRKLGGFLSASEISLSFLLSRMSSQTLSLVEDINAFSSTQAPTILELGQREWAERGIPLFLREIW